MNDSQREVLEEVYRRLQFVDAEITEIQKLWEKFRELEDADR